MERKERTEIQVFRDMASALTGSKIPPPPSIDQFHTWRRAFERKMREQPRLQKRFSGLIEAGCDKDDLEGALWSVALSVHFSQITVMTEIRDFFALAETLLPQLEELKPNLEMLLNWRLQNKLHPGFGAFWGSLDRLLPHLRIPRKRSVILRIPNLIDHLDVMLKAILDTYKMHASTLAALSVSVPEVLLFEYVKRATHSRAEVDEIMHQIQQLQELAFDAYGTEGLQTRVYEAQSWARRYRRFKRERRKIQEAIVRVVEEFMEEKARSKNASLVRFFHDSYPAAVRRS